MLDPAKEKQFLDAFESYSNALYRHSFFRISDKERSRELVQDTFMKAWEYVARGEEIGKYKPFLYKILNNLIIDEYRKAHPVSLDELLEKEEVNEGNFADLRDETNVETAGVAIDVQRLLRVLESIPDTYREVITLRYIDGLTTQEIASLIEESENNVSVRLHRGLRILRKAFEELPPRGKI